MKAKTLTAMIIDQDPEYAKAMTNTIKELFHKVYCQVNFTAALKEFKDVKPQVIFINLTIDQRSLALETLEKLNFRPEEPTIVFGYNDTLEPEFLGHAIESGIDDIFVRPFDGDIISSKITRYFQYEKTMDRELQYSSLNPPIKALVNFPMKLVAVDENGITLKCDHYISKGTILPFKNTLMKSIFDTDSIELMVTRTWPAEDWKEYFLFAEPKISNEQTNAALRRFILGKL